MTRVAVVVLAGAVLTAAFVGEARVFAVAIGAAALAYLALRTMLIVRRWRGRHAVTRLREMTAGHFEREVGAWFARDGWVVEQRGGSGDEGVDLVAFRGECIVVVQCKRYAEHAAVTPAQVRELYGAAAATGATHALLVTTGRFTAAASSWAASLDGEPRMVLLGPSEIGVFRRSPRAQLAAP